MSKGWDDWKHSVAHLRTLLQHRYTLGPLLDKGGVAEIYKATSLGDPTHQVAVKILRPLLSLDDQIQAMFEDEICVCLQLSHPHVVRSLHGETHTRPAYLVMEYIPGCNLSQFHTWLQQQDAPPPWELAYTISKAIVHALHYLHNARSQQDEPLHLIHRDLSPPNVLLGHNGDVKLTDFGIAIYQDMSRQTAGKDPKGRFSYIAPETLQGISIDQRADLFSWGIITWELLTGHRLFEASTPEETLKLLGDAPILPPRSFNASIPQAFEDIVMCALQRKREERYPTAQALYSACSSIETPFFNVGSWIDQMQREQGASFPS